MTSSLLAAVAGWGIASGAPPAPIDRPLDPATWGAFHGTARAERLVPVLSWAVDAGWWPATAEQRAQLLATHRSLLGGSLVLERVLVDVAAELDQRGVPFRVLKGPAIAHLDESDPSLRTFGDLDLLVAADHLDAVRDRLLAEGGRRRYPEPRPGFDRRFSKGLCVVRPDGVELDLHRTLCPGPFGLTLDLHELFAGSERFTVGAQPLPALDRPRRFVHACLHAVLGTAAARPAQLRDVAVTCPTDPAAAADAVALAERWETGIVVARAVRLARDTLRWQPPDALDAWREAHVPTPTDRRRLRPYLGVQRSGPVQALRSLGAVRGVRAKAAFAIAVALPRAGSHRRRLGRAVHDLAGPR